jgi:hypothetical protein
MAVETVFGQDGPYNTLKVDRWTGWRWFLCLQKLREEASEQNYKSQ